MKAASPAPQTDSPLGSEFSDIKIANPGGTKELIMIVDDEAFVTLLALRVLTDDGYRVITARDGFECLAIYKRLKEKISLIIMDFTMPIMDGSEVFDELRVINPRVCVVLSSGFTEQEKLRGMLAKGLRGFIPKPYTQQKLLLQVRTTLDTLKTEK
jgi:CheY-like chemotaxis protein